MAGQPPLSIALDALPANAVVADLVYVPLATPLLAAARARGLRCADGLGMLLPGGAAVFLVVRRQARRDARAARAGRGRSRRRGAVRSGGEGLTGGRGPGSARPIGDTRASRYASYPPYPALNFAPSRRIGGGER